MVATVLFLLVFALAMHFLFDESATGSLHEGRHSGRCRGDNATTLHVAAVEAAALDDGTLD